MALTQTTLSSACGQLDTTISVASATGFVIGNLIRVDQEVMKVTQGYISGTTIPVLRGLDGTAQLAHKSGAFAIAELPTDLAAIAPQAGTQFPTARARVVSSISVTGVIPIPDPGSDRIVVLNGTTIIAGTLANPRTDQDGDMLAIVGNGLAAHTVTYTAGLGNVGGTADVLTFSATQAGGVLLVAVGGFWVSVGLVAGAATIGGVGIA